MTTSLFLSGGRKHGGKRRKKGEVLGQFTCERPGEGAGWGAEGGPVIGCGALFISRGSACGGRCGPVWTERKRKCRQRQEVKNDGVAVAGGPTEPAQVQITGHYRHNVEFLQNAEIKQPVIGSLPVASDVRNTTYKVSGRFPRRVRNIHLFQSQPIIKLLK